MRPNGRQKWSMSKFINELRERLSKLIASEASGNSKLYIKENYGFHMCVYRQSQSSVLISIIENLWLQVSPYLHLLREFEEFPVVEQLSQTAI